MPCAVYRAIVRHQQHDVETPGAAQRIDRLLRGLRDRAGDVEGGVDGYLNADAPAERFQIGVGEGIVLRTHDLNPPRSVRMNHRRNFAARLRLRRPQRHEAISG